MIFDYIKFPKKSYLNDNIKITDFKDKTSSVIYSLINKKVREVELISYINEQQSNMFLYKDENICYEAILVLHIKLLDNDNIKQLNECFHQIFPNPIIVIYQYNDLYYLSTALKRINKVEHNKSVIERIFISNKLSLNKNVITILENCNNELSNLFEYYNNFCNVICALNVYELNNTIPIINDNLKDVIKHIEVITKEIRQLEEQYKIATSMRKKMDITMKVKELKNKI